MNLTGAELIIRFLENRSTVQRSAETVAVIAGGRALLPLQRALADSSLRRVRNGDASVLLFDFGAGLAGAAGTLIRAKTERRPLVGIVTQVRRSLIGSEACRPEETRRILDPLSKHWFHVNAAMELLQLLPEAFRLARSGRRGPVLLEIPEDVLTELIQGAWIPQTQEQARASARSLRATAAAPLHA